MGEAAALACLSVALARCSRRRVCSKASAHGWLGAAKRRIGEIIVVGGADEERADTAADFPAAVAADASGSAPQRSGADSGADCGG